MADLDLTSIECAIESQGGLTITVGEKKNLVCKVPAIAAPPTASVPVGAPTTSPTAASVSSATVSPGGPVFYNADTAHPYDIQFIGDPQLAAVPASATAPAATVITQTFTSYKVGFKNIAAARLRFAGREFAVTPLRFEVKSVIEQKPQGASPQNALPGQAQNQAMAQNQDQASAEQQAGQAANPQSPRADSGQVQQPSEPKPFPVMGPEGVAAPWWWWAFWVAIALAAVSYLVRTIIRYQKNKKVAREVQAAVLTPQQKFQQRLRKLESQGYHLQSKYKSFALELTAIVKSSVGEVLRFAAEDMTTEELLETLQKKHRGFYQSVGPTIKNLMAELDQIKFAKTETSSERCLMLLDDTNKVGRSLFGGDP